LIFKGKVHRFGKNIDTDIIIPATYLVTFDPKELAKHCMEPLEPNFVEKVQPGDILVADENFGCGSSREHAPIAIKGAGISCVIAKSFARIFYRNAINMGLPIFECPEAVEETKSGDVLEVDTSTGKIKNLTSGKEFQAQPFPDFIATLIEAGGLIEYTKKKLGIG
jgi:3-isopropylmalate/(R)-2-methylmalate dehydratase small subunit